MSQAELTRKPMKIRGNGRPSVDLLRMTCLSSSIGEAMRAYKKRVVMIPKRCSTRSGCSY